MAKPLTRPYADTFRERVQSDAEFRRLLVLQIVTCLSEGDIIIGKELIDNYIVATVGFDELGNALKKSPKPLRRMLRDNDRTCSSDLVAIVDYLKKLEKVEISISCERMPDRNTAGEKAVA